MSIVQTTAQILTLAELNQTLLTRLVRSGAIALLLSLSLTMSLGTPLFAQSTTTQADSQDETQDEAQDETGAAVALPGLLIVEVLPDSAAALVGLARGDILLEIDGATIDAVSDLLAALDALEAGATVEIKWQHGSQQRTAQVELDEQDGLAFLGIRPYMDIQDARAGRFAIHAGQTTDTEIWEHSPGQWGMGDGMGRFRFEMAPQTGETGRGMMGRGMMIAPHMFGSQGSSWIAGDVEGVLVAQVVPGSPAHAVGLTSGSVIVAFNGEPINDPAILQTMVGSLLPGEPVTLEVWNLDAEETIELSVDLAASEADAETAFLGVRVVSATPLNRGGMFRSAPAVGVWSGQDMTSPRVFRFAQPEMMGPGMRGLEAGRTGRFYFEGGESGRFGIGIDNREMMRQWLRQLAEIMGIDPNDLPDIFGSSDAPEPAQPQPVQPQDSLELQNRPGPFAIPDGNELPTRRSFADFF